VIYEIFPAVVDEPGLCCNRFVSCFMHGLLEPLDRAPDPLPQLWHLAFAEEDEDDDQEQQQFHSPA
jgi:hypothetical protein